MIMPRHAPPGSYIDDPSSKMDRPEEDVREMAIKMAGKLHVHTNEWTTRGRGGVRQRAFRWDIATLCICPQFLPCKHPSAAWVGRQHGVSREYAARLCREFAREFGDYIQFRGQRFLNATGTGAAGRGGAVARPGRRRIAVSSSVAVPQARLRIS